MLAAATCVCAEDFISVLLAVTPLEVTIPVELFASVRSTKKTEAVMMFSGVTGKSEGREAPRPRLLMLAHINP